jgi:hypothetical protein
VSANAVHHPCLRRGQMPSPASEAALEQAKQQLAEAQRALDSEVSATDPSQPEAFASLVGKRDAIRGLLEALQVRKAAQQGRVEAAKKAVLEATAVCRRERADEAQAEAAQVELELVDALATAADKVKASIEKVRPLKADCRGTKSPWLDCSPDHFEEQARRFVNLRIEAFRRAREAGTGKPDASEVLREILDEWLLTRRKR